MKLHLIVVLNAYCAKTISQNSANLGKLHRLAINITSNNNI